MSRLTVESLSKRYAAGDPLAVDELSFEVGREEVFSLVGPSGCGKTTTLRIIAGFEAPDAGRVSLGETVVEAPGVHVPPEKRRVGLVFQELALFPHRSVLGNVTFGLRKMSRRARRQRAMEVLEMVGMARYADRRPQQLSGGQQQRVALARSIAPAPRIILLDEPFANLDPALRNETRERVKRVLKDNRMSALLVTHDQEEALSFADRIGVMNEGRILQTGPPERVYNEPADPFVARFLGQTNLLPAEASGERAETPIGNICLSGRASGPVLLSVRPEQLRLTEPDERNPIGEVVSRQFKGHDLTFHIRFGDRSYTVQTDHTCPYQPGQRVSVVHTEPAVVVQRDGQPSG